MKCRIDHNDDCVGGCDRLCQQLAEPLPNLADACWPLPAFGRNYVTTTSVYWTPSDGPYARADEYVYRVGSL